MRPSTSPGFVPPVGQTVWYPPGWVRVVAKGDALGRSGTSFIVHVILYCDWLNIWARPLTQPMAGSVTKVATNENQTLKVGASDTKTLINNNTLNPQIKTEI